MAMSEKLLTYVLRESETGIRMMSERSLPLHVFNYGSAPDGTKFVFVMQVIAEDEFNRWCKSIDLKLVDSPPLENAAVERTQFSQAAAQPEANT